jgi:probable phosphoglycerate mutase
MLEAQARMVAELERIRESHPDGVVAVFSHSDIIRAAVLHYAGMPLDLFERIEIQPASVSVIELGDAGPRILKLNETG